MSSTSSGFDSRWENQIYSEQKHINKYPFGELVPHVMRKFAKDLRAGRPLKALELGCGTGNNLLFLAREGFDTVGVDGSASAVQRAKDFLSQEGQSAQVTVMDFTQLEFEDSSFDFILDRQSISCLTPPLLPALNEQITRLLKPEGYFLSFAYSDRHGSITHDQGKELESHLWGHFKSGPFADMGRVILFSKELLVQTLMKGFRIEYLKHHQVDLLVPDERNEYAEWICLGQKI